VIFLLIAWGLASPLFAMSWYDSMLFQPWLTTGNASIEAISGTRKATVTIATPSGNKLNAWYFKLPYAERTVLLSHGGSGNASDRSELIASLLGHHASVFIYDYSGYGASTGKPSLEQIMTDGDAAYNYLVHDLKIDPNTIVIAGESLGSGVACHIAAVQNCHSLLLLSPFDSLLKLARTKLPWLYLYPVSWFHHQDIDNHATLVGFQKPLLIIHGEQDTTFPRGEAKDLAKDCSTATVVEVPCGHTVYAPLTPEYQNALKHFFK
jgi:pimeloyl-ACP methyl ester carboxylesterase